MCKASSFGILTALISFLLQFLFVVLDFRCFIASGRMSALASVPQLYHPGFRTPSVQLAMHQRRAAKAAESIELSGVWSLMWVCGVSGLFTLLEVQQDPQQCKSVRSVFVSLPFYRKISKAPFWIFQCVAIKMFWYLSIFKVAGYSAPPFQNWHFFLGFLWCVFTVGNFINGKSQLHQLQLFIALLSSWMAILAQRLLVMHSPSAELF